VALILAGLNALAPPILPRGPGPVHVAPNGFDGGDGRSRQRAVRSLQRGVDLARPGDTVLIWPGTYHETVRIRRGGRAGHPLVLQAAVPGQAILSGSDGTGEVARWRWRRWQPHLFVTPIRWPVQALRVDGWAAYRAGSLPHLRDLCARTSAGPAFYAANSQLVLCLPQGQTPTGSQLEVHRPLPRRLKAGGHQAALLWLEAPHLQIRDLQFDFAVTAAIQLWSTGDVLIRGNRFRDADVAINDRASLNPVDGLRIERNLSQCPGLDRWRRGWLSRSEIYRYSNCTLVWVGGRNLSIRGNVISDAGDGLKVSPSGGRNRVSGNLIDRVFDDGIEFDGPAANLLVDHNLLSHTLVALGTSPVTRGPLLVDTNLILNDPGQAGALLKLMAGAAPSLGPQPQATIRNVLLRHNLAVVDALAWRDPAVRLEQIRLEANLLLSRQDFGERLPAGLKLSANRLVPLPKGARPLPEQGATALAPWWSGRSNPGTGNPGPGPGGLPLAIGPLGPAWLKLGDDPFTASLGPLLRAGWLTPEPSGGPER